jgi:predicted metal-dependent hydrolase
MSPDAERNLYLEGIRLFNDREFFAAHEVWENLWRAGEGIEREYFQGLLQCAVALEHYRRGNARGVASLYSSYRRHFSAVPERFMGLDVEKFLEAMKAALAPVLDRVRLPNRGEMRLDPNCAPRIVLQSDPGETPQ